MFCSDEGSYKMSNTWKSSLTKPQISDQNVYVRNMFWLCKTNFIIVLSNLKLLNKSQYSY